MLCALDSGLRNDAIIGRKLQHEADPRGIIARGRIIGDLDHGGSKHGDLVEVRLGSIEGSVGFLLLSVGIQEWVDVMFVLGAVGLMGSTSVLGSGSGGAEGSAVLGTDVLVGLVEVSVLGAVLNEVLKGQWIFIVRSKAGCK